MLTASIFFIVIGALLVLGGYLWSLQITHTSGYTGQTEGTVASLEVGEPDALGSGAGIHDYYYPVVTYYANGMLYRERCRKGANPPEYGVGQKVTVYYEERHPENFELNAEGVHTHLARTLYYCGFVCCCIGGIFFLLFATRG